MRCGRRVAPGRQGGSPERRDARASLAPPRRALRRRPIRVSGLALAADRRRRFARAADSPRPRRSRGRVDGEHARRVARDARAVPRRERGVAGDRVSPPGRGLRQAGYRGRRVGFGRRRRRAGPGGRRVRPGGRVSRGAVARGGSRGSRGAHHERARAGSRAEPKGASVVFDSEALVPARSAGRDGGGRQARPRALAPRVRDVPVTARSQGCGLHGRVRVSRVHAAAVARARRRRGGPPSPAVSQTRRRNGGFDTRNARRGRSRHPRPAVIRRRPSRAYRRSVAAVMRAEGARCGVRRVGQRQGELDRRGGCRTPVEIRPRQRVRSHAVGRTQTPGRAVRPEGTKPEGAARPARALPDRSVRYRRPRRGARVARGEKEPRRGGTGGVGAIRGEDVGVQL